MQKESMHFSTSGTVIQDQAVSPESSIKPLECSHCTLAFKSKVCLFEHLNKEHGFAVDAALRGAGLKCAETNKADADNSSNGLGGSFECQQCNFKACSLDYLNQHVKICQKNLCHSEIPETKKAVITKQHKEAAAAKDIPTVPSVMSTSKTKCPLNSSKDLKTYKRPLETITKYFKPSSASKGKPPVQLAESPLPFDSTKETLILRESPSSSSPNSSGVFKVTANSTIDLSNYSIHPHRSLLVDHLQILDLRSPNNSTTADDIDTRTNNEMLSGPLAKKAKPDKANTSKPQSLSSRELSFEFSEDDEEKNVDLVNGDTESSNIFICKHCDHSNESFKKLASHYQNSHPYVRYNIVYIKDPSDQSATFRCLDCPVEFPSVADLKSHYSEKHPEAPDVFTMPARELNLVFKCFECPFTIGTSKILESHYEEKHPEHKVESHLMYCRYSASTHQEEPLQLNTCEKEPNPEEPGGISPESACSLCEEVKNPTNPPTGEGADVALYYCRNCEFSHKSVVVLHVHYQKSHPGEAVTIDKIKLSCSRVMSHTPWTNESPNLLTMTEKPTPQMNALDYSTRGDAEQSPKKKIILTLRKPKATQEASETNSESEKVESAEDLSTGKRTPTKSNGEMSLETHSLSNNSPDKLYNCQYCSYSSNNLRGVVAHQNNKHVVPGFTSFQDVIQYNEMQKNKLPNEAKDSACTTAPNSKTSIQVEVSSEKELQHEVDNESDASQMGVNAFARGENLFFCQTCNYGNPTVKGVYTHQSKSHSKVGYTKERIIDYTALLRDKIKKFTTQAKELSFCTNLPLPLINKGDEYLFFCHFCNYRQRTAEKVVQHSIRRHRRFTVNTQQVCQYTAMVLKDKQKSHPKTTANQKVSHASVWEKVKKKKKTTKKLCKVSASPPMRDSQTQRTLQCHRCEYNTQYVYLLRRHFWKSHKSNRCTAEVLKMCYQQGFVQAGYHCDLCVFSHKEASVVHEHFQKKHPGRNPSLEYVTNRLHVSPDTSSPKKTKKLKIKHTDDSDDNLPSQRSGQNENKTYSCRACSFKGSSFSSLACHYRAVHPWSVKEDGSVLDVIDTTRLSANRDVEENHETPGLFDTYQVPLEVDSSPDSSDEAAVSSVSFNCSYCPARFDTQHGVNIHIGMKHHNDENVDAKEQEQVKLKTRMHVFKCPHCTYVNTKFQGVLTHCQKRHPALSPRADSLHIDTSHLHNSEDCVKNNGPGLRFGGYMCETCPRIFITQEKLNQHCEMQHNETVPNTLKTAPKTSAKSKKNLSNTVCNQGSISKVSFLSRNMYSLVRCQQCAYSCTTKNALDRHMRVRHKNESVRKVRGPSYNCALCPSSYILKKALGNHYIKKHGQESFSEYYAPLYKTVHRMPAQGSDGNKILVYKCPNCPYVNSSPHGVLTHCQMSHPSFVARANDLQTDEILKSNMVGCTVGKGFNERGYTCRKCPQMYISMKKLKIHCERDHGKVKAAAPEHSSKIESEKQPAYISDMSVLEAFSLQNKTSALTTKRMLPGHQLGTPEICQSNSLLEQTQDLPYKCKMCAYSGSCRKYLHAHYRKLHKLGVLATFNVLGSYNKRKSSWAQQPETETENDGPVKCKICQNWFHSSQQLLAHYSTFHSLDRILDFTVLSKASKRSTGLYKCALCQKQMNGIKKLCAHLDRHREMAQIMAKVAKTKASAVVTTTPEAKDIQPCQQDELPILENVEDLAKRNVVPVETFTLPRSPSSPLKPTDVEQTELGSGEDNRTCKQCNRTFMSSKGLRTHERSHATMAAIEKLPASVLKHNIDKHVQFKPGTLRPYLCSLCPFRSTVMGLWRSHFLKKHEDVLMDPAETDIQDEESAQRADKEDASEELNNFPELDEEPEIAERSMYLEPPDVQRQLNHYTLMAQGGASSKANVQDTNASEKTLLHCEFCNFNSGHIRSIRRHYLNRYGKRILTCKECNFFTGTRKTMDMHIKMGHSTCQSEPTHQKDLRCPFCLYQTKNKNNMIDHIDLHREERVVPIEVRRPKLSRYLQDIIFRCHKCTFTSGSAENLRLHLIRHNDIKPYKCRLCYFDCPWLSDLEAHLSDKHQVLRNHELVGQVSLDQLEERVDRMAGEEEEPLCNHNNDNEEVNERGSVNDCHEVPHETQAKNQGDNSIIERITLHIKEANRKQGQDGKNINEEIAAKSSESHLQYENTKPNTTVQEKQDPVTVTEDVVEQTVEEGNNADIEMADCNFSEKHSHTNEDQPKRREDAGITLALQKEGAAEGSSTTHGRMAEKAQTHTLHLKALQQRMINIKVRAEDDKLPCDPLVEDDDIGKDRTVQLKTMLSEEAHNLKNKVNTEATSKKNHVQQINIKPLNSFTVERHLLRLTPNSAILKLSHNKSFGVSFAKFKEEQAKRKGEKARVTCGGMPEREKECLREERPPIGCPKEKDQNDHVEPKQVKDDENQHAKHKDADGIKETDNPHVPKAIIDGAAEVLCPSATEEKLFTCEFCGRNLTNSSELERHVMRHGI